VVDEWDLMMLVFGNDPKQRERVVALKYGFPPGVEVEVGDGGPVTRVFSVPTLPYLDTGQE
jgi:hypothetical protein